MLLPGCTQHFNRAERHPSLGGAGNMEPLPFYVDVLTSIMYVEEPIYKIVK